MREVLRGGSRLYRLLYGILCDLLQLQASKTDGYALRSWPCVQLLVHLPTLWALQVLQFFPDSPYYFDLRHIDQRLIATSHMHLAHKNVLPIMAPVLQINAAHVNSIQSPYVTNYTSFQCLAHAPQFHGMEVDAWARWWTIVANKSYVKRGRANGGPNCFGQ
ncbi:MAG: hypothetical protein M1305_06640 [Candidatus Marsarchaeota archaeon]|nr:hypothetical protein [Candidatus Marsarchaeota archaeon]